MVGPIRLQLGVSMVSCVFLLACGGSDPQGAPGQACYPNGTCNVGLSCSGGTCMAAGSDAGTDAGTGDTGGIETDAGTDAPAASCDPFEELDETATSSCGAGMRCARRFDDGSYECAPDGVVPINGYCSLRGTGLDDCAIGSECQSPGICLQRCVEGESTCYTGRSCFGTAPTFEGFCYDDCDVFGETASLACGGREACAVLPNGMGAMLATCVGLDGTRELGDDCSDAPICIGSICGTRLPGAPTSTCLGVCDDEHGCSEGVCRPFEDSPVPGLGYRSPKL